MQIICWAYAVKCIKVLASVSSNLVTVLYPALYRLTRQLPQSKMEFYPGLRINLQGCRQICPLGVSELPRDTTFALACKAIHFRRVKSNKEWRMLLKFRGWGWNWWDDNTCLTLMSLGQPLPSHHSMKASLRRSGQARGSPQSEQDQQPREPFWRDLLQVYEAGWQKMREQF